VALIIFDIQGKVIEKLFQGQKPAGKNSIVFDGSNLASGLYFYTLKTDNFAISKKMLLIK